MIVGPRLQAQSQPLFGKPGHRKAHAQASSNHPQSLKRPSRLALMDLPPEIHFRYARHLDAASHRRLAATSRSAQHLHARASSRRLALDGAPQLLRALDMPDWGRKGWYRCPHTTGYRHPFYQPDEEAEEESEQQDSGEPDLDDAFDGHGGGCHLLGQPVHASSHDVKSLRTKHGPRDALSQVRELELHSPAQWPNRGRAENALLLHSVAASLGIPNLVAAISKAAPQLRSLTVDQSLIPLSKRLCLDLSSQNPHLRHLVFHSRFCDASGLAHLISSLKELRSLEVSSVGTCPCQPQAVTEGAKHLLQALKRHANLKRLVLVSSKVLGVEQSLILRGLAQASTATRAQQTPGHHHHHQDGHEGLELRLEELEIRRCPLDGEALNAFLASQASSLLRRLYLGGLRKVKSKHLLPPKPRLSSPATATAPEHEHDEGKSGVANDFWTSSMPLELELDSSVISAKLLASLSHRLFSLRIYLALPSPPLEALLLEALGRGQLPRLRMLKLALRGGSDGGDSDEVAMKLKRRLDEATAQGAKDGEGRAAGGNVAEIIVGCPCYAPGEASVDGGGSAQASCDGEDEEKAASSEDGEEGDGEALGSEGDEADESSSMMA